MAQIVIADPGGKDGGKLIVDKPSFVDFETASAKAEVQQRCQRHETSRCSQQRPLAGNIKWFDFWKSPLPQQLIM
jgi:hypothetical protein